MPTIQPETKITATKRAALAGLRQFNRAATGPRKYRQLAFSLRDHGEIVGGITGWVWGTTLFVEMFWISEGYRGQAFGTALLRQLEAEGRRLGAVQAYVDTFSFQAPKFYESQGYAEFGRLPHAVGEHDRIWLMKRF